MKIKLVEQILGLPRETVRYYEKEGLISPKHNENRYREYEEEDIERLRTIIVLRKLGVSIAEIHSVLSGIADLKTVIEKNEARLRAERENIDLAIETCNRISSDKSGEFNVDYYFKVLGGLPGIEKHEV